MPLIIETKLNGNSLGWMKIFREEKLKGNDYVHAYTAQSLTFEQGLTQSAPEIITALFEHKYSDGYKVCVAKAMLAIAEKENSNG